jgi:hypothetical protein
MIEITKKLTETYTLRGEQSLWAKINLEYGEKSVNVMINSDYGSYAYYWGSTGENPKSFLCNISKHYTMLKFAGENIYEADWEKRLERIYKEIEYKLKEKEITKEEAIIAKKEAKKIINYGTSEDIYFKEMMENEYLEKIFYDFEIIPEDIKIKSTVDMFWENIWIPFINELKKEI